MYINTVTSCDMIILYILVLEFIFQKRNSNLTNISKKTYLIYFYEYEYYCNILQHDDFINFSIGV